MNDTRHIRAWLAMAAAVPLSIYAALFFGSYPLPADAIHQAIGAMLHGQAETQALVIVRDIRLGRILLSFLTGAALAVSGGVFQGLLRNPLADPFTLGISSGAACGAALALGMGWTVAGLSTLPLAALGGAFAAMILVLAMSRLAGDFSRESLVLGGIVVSTFLGALIALIKSLNEESVAAIVFWIMGSFQGRGFEHIELMLPYMAAGCALVLFLARELDILGLGSEQAAQVGVSVGRARIGLLVGAGMLTAAAVSVSGIIGFVGLVVPHLVRMLIGPDSRPLLLFSALGGGILLLWSDVLARTILSYGAELPVGVVTALFGGPFFCLILARGRRP
ncbi:FecCD family ABC transporter permease [Desulfomicrobium baculatum]|uniref:Transport system permease protein n=1 Tax=Desulfomicrobium baculatum (strain DSM 4028 / VKM B-1378 / X) TaxID=525897 RepID=C7LVY4_DESBD|nr:iron ABC transporter permease [Desulfomicrobium baculatum]ACU89802.1 transport system permease protein [Desulfomicrobium baculatum DSM 4028]